MNVVEVINPQALTAKPVQDFMFEAVRASSVGEPDLAQAANNLITAILSKNTAVFVGTEDQMFKSLAIVSLPSPGEAQVPQVPHFYNAGSPKLKRETVQKVVDFVIEKGYNSFWAINGTGTADSVWARSFRRAGKSHKIGSIMEFTIE